MSNELSVHYFPKKKVSTVSLEDPPKKKVSTPIISSASLDRKKNVSTPRTSAVSLDAHSLEAQINHPEVVKNMPSKNNNYIYVNRGYAGNVSSYNDLSSIREEPATGVVVREQYWACSKWPRAQRFLALAVGVLIGALIGLAVTLVVKLPGGNPIVDNILTSATRE